MKKHVSIGAGLMFFAVTFSLVTLTSSLANAVTYYWDNDGVTAGFGTAAGTWADPTTGDSTQGWSTSATGELVPATLTTLAADVLNFGNGATGLGAGTVTVSGSVAASSVNFASGSGAITLASSGGIINAVSIVAQNTGNIINPDIVLTAAGTVSFGRPVNSTGSLTIGGQISGNFGLTFTTPNVASNNNLQTVILNSPATYTGSTTITTGNSANTTSIRAGAGVDNALPVTTILSLTGGVGAGTGRTVSYDLNSNDQTLAGLQNTAANLRTQRILNTGGGAATLTINDSGNRTFSGIIGGTNLAVTKTNSGNWTLSGNNTYTGVTNINGGTITVSSDTALGATTANTVVASGARLFVNTNNRSTAEPLNIAGAGIAGGNGAIHIGGNATGVAFTGAITLSGNSTIQTDGGTNTTFSGGIDTAGFALTFNQSGTATISTSGIIGAGGSVTKNTGGVLNLNVANTYDGLTTVNGGAVTVRHADALGTTTAGTVVIGSGTGSANNARLDVTDGTTVTGESVTISGVGNFLGALTSGAGNNVWAGNVTIGAAGTRIGTSAGASLEVSGVIDSGVDPHGLVVRTTDLTGVVILSGANNYLGNTQVLIGKLQLAGGDNRLPIGTNLNLNSGGTNPDAEFDLNGRNQEVAGLSNGGVAAQNSVNNSSLTASTLTVNTALAPSSFGGILKGNLALTKTGIDTLTISGTNTYSGETNVNAGSLLINGDNSAAMGNVNVAVNAVLGGSGMIGGAVNVLGTLAPGNSIGTMSTGALTIDGGDFNVDLDPSTTALNVIPADLAAVTGQLSLLNSPELNLSIFGLDALLAPGDKATIISYTSWNGGLFDGLADDSTFTFLLNTYEIDYNDGNAVTLTVVPEPSTLVLASLGLIGLAVARRRRK